VNTEKTTETAGLRDGKLKAKPIMVYPLTPADRAAIVEAAARSARPGQTISISNFIMTTMLDAIKRDPNI